MQFEAYSHRYGLDIVKINKQHKANYEELVEVLDSIDDQELIADFEANSNNNKSLSNSINRLIRSNLIAKGWKKESAIFQDSSYTSNKVWRLDFAKDTMSVEVAFNHGEAIVWNLMKPTIASEQNHVKKAIETEIGIYITATSSMKKAGGFDSAIGEYEKVLRYFKPLQHKLLVPMIIIGLKAPATFKVKHKKVDGKNIGEIVMLNS